MKTIIAIEGHDRTGKDTVLKALPGLIESGQLAGLTPHNATVFDQDPIRDKYKEIIEDYKNPENWRAFMTGFIGEVSRELASLLETYDYVFVTRWTVSEMVFNDMFDREQDMYIVRDTMAELMPHVDVKSFIMAWDSYDDYLARLEQIGDKDIQYSADEVKDLELLFDKYKSYTDEVHRVKSYETVTDIILGDSFTRFMAGATKAPFALVPSSKWDKWPKKIIVSDMDGVLTNGTSLYDRFGKTLKEYGSYDKEALRFAQDAGWEIVFVSADKLGFGISATRAGDLGIYVEEAGPKERADLILKYKRAGYFTVFIGDSISDIPAMEAAGFAGTTANASPIVRNFLKDGRKNSYVSPLDGGRGGFGDILFNILLDSK